MRYLCSMKIEKHVRGNSNDTEVDENSKFQFFLICICDVLMKINCAHINMLLFGGNLSRAVISLKSDMLKAFMDKFFNFHRSYDEL